MRIRQGRGCHEAPALIDHPFGSRHSPWPATQSPGLALPGSGPPGALGLAWLAHAPSLALRHAWHARATGGLPGRVGSDLALCLPAGAGWCHRWCHGPHAGRLARASLLVSALCMLPGHGMLNPMHDRKAGVAGGLLAAD